MATTAMEEATAVASSEASEKVVEEGEAKAVQVEVEAVKVEELLNKNEKQGALDAQWGNLVNFWATMNTPGRRSSSESGLNCTAPSSSSLPRRCSSPLQKGFKMWDNQYAFEEQRLQRGRRLLESGSSLCTAMAAAMDDAGYLSEELCSGDGLREPALPQTTSETFSESESHVCTVNGCAPLTHLFSSTSSSSSPLPAYRKNKVAVVEKEEEEEEEDVGGGKKRRVSRWCQAMSFIIWFVGVLVLGMVLGPAAELYIFHETQDTVFLKPT